MSRGTYQKTFITGAETDLFEYTIDKNDPGIYQFQINNYYNINDNTLLCVKILGYYSILLDESAEQYIAFDGRITTTNEFDDIGAPKGAKYLKTDTDGYIRVDFIEHAGVKELPDDLW